MKKQVCLIILDGFGIADWYQNNPIFAANMPNFKFARANYPYISLEAASLNVGLPWGEEGNSEVGHLTIGLGRVIYQYYPRISLAIRDGSFFKNQTLEQGFLFAKEKNSAVHLLGLLTDGNVHASFEHLEALIEFASRMKISKLYLHLFTDGRDSPPRGGRDLIQKLEGILKEKGLGEIASLSGRFYAMDRTEKWNRVESVYQLLTTGLAETQKTPEDALQTAYKQGLTDEFVKPTIISPDDSKKYIIRDNDVLMFFNFREDRARELASVFIDKNFDKFELNHPQNLHLITMTLFREDFTNPVAFPPQEISYSLSQILSDNKKYQLKIAESEKYAHITYFFNGYQEKPFTNEYWVVVPSLPQVEFERYPQLRSIEIKDRLITGFKEGIYDFFVANFANPDLMGHTGNFDLCVRSLEILDQQLGEIINEALKKDITILLTADHGNIERVFNPITGEQETKHDVSSVPCLLINQQLKLSVPRTDEEIKKEESGSLGTLADIAPTILDMFGIAPPEQMTGMSLLKFLK